MDYNPPNAPPYAPDMPDNPELDYLHHKFLIISYVTCVFAVVLFAVYAAVRYFLRVDMLLVTSEAFITARGTQNGWRIGYSFFATAVGAWCITGPATFAAYTGIIGLLMYAISSGLPILILALFGASITRKHPDCLSLSDFVGKRYGPTFQTMVMFICVFNLSIAMLAEYTTVGSLFHDFVGSIPFPMIITVAHSGKESLSSTTTWGLYISIITDQVQAMLTTSLIAILVIYCLARFRHTLDPSLVAVGTPLGPNVAGYGTIFSLPCSLMAATVFSEALWQKVWASKDRQSLVFGGTLGFVMVTTAVFLFGFGGWLSAWAGLVNKNTNQNLFLFQVFSDEAGDLNYRETSSAQHALPAPRPDPGWGSVVAVQPSRTESGAPAATAVGPGLCTPRAPRPTQSSTPQLLGRWSAMPPTPPSFLPWVPSSAPGWASSRIIPGIAPIIRSWVGVVVLILTVTMNESAIDGMQNGLVSSFSSHWFKGQHPIFPRLIVLALNVPIMIVSFQGYTILSLFVITNVLCSCCFIPVCVGLSERIRPYVSETCAMAGCFVGILSVSAYGAGSWWDPNDKHASLAYGVWLTCHTRAHTPQPHLSGCELPASFAHTLVLFAWYGNANYNYDYFLVASGFSVVGMVLWALPAFLLKRYLGVEGPGISGVLSKIPGFRIATGERYTDILTFRYMRWLGLLLGHNPGTPALSLAAYPSGDSDPKMVLEMGKTDQVKGSTDDDGAYDGGLAPHKGSPGVA
ncbi:MAG: hypothetical protein WDW38_010808 [Sanguina aurantia]